MDLCRFRFVIDQIFADPQSGQAREDVQSKILSGLKSVGEFINGDAGGARQSLFDAFAGKGYFNCARDPLELYVIRKVHYRKKSTNQSTGHIENALVAPSFCFWFLQIQNIHSSTCENSQKAVWFTECRLKIKVDGVVEKKVGKFQVEKVLVQCYF